MYWSMGAVLRSSATLSANTTETHTLDLSAENFERGALQATVVFPSSDHQGVLVECTRSVDASTTEEADTSPIRVRIDPGGDLTCTRVINFEWPYCIIRVTNLDGATDVDVEVKYSFGFYP